MVTLFFYILLVGSQYEGRVYGPFPTLEACQQDQLWYAAHETSSHCYALDNGGMDDP